MSALYRLVYASKNFLEGIEAEAAVEQILEASRRANERLEVTGALMFNGGAFAQVLEGPQKGVEQTFERIQCDPRHGDVTVLEGGPITERGFVNWSMAFVGRSARGQALWNELAAESGFDLARLSADAVFTMLHDLVLEEESLGSLEDAPAADAPIQRLPDVPQAREDVARPGPEVGTNTERQDASADQAGVVALAILKAALADERDRTTELRGTVDELRIAIADPCRMRSAPGRARSVDAACPRPNRSPLRGAAGDPRHPLRYRSPSCIRRGSAGSLIASLDRPMRPP
ncbi:BLUF domain-containing protein [Methylobacterium sp. E-065]|uniref:BLUF domain-containing protein n=1 Tax=Methylobacterium sp. E-065 TaxID=2836583 RepID=UPI001FBAA933|nr:BLUF domain-containing protein [Methylobacterium sp. E-065]MCJ2016932.1 BLUF domain-containing protein [Methylobacterium sp. E-065]